MIPNAFIDKPSQPTDAELAAALGSAKPLWDQLLAELAAEHEVNVREWKSYSRKAGWSLRAKRKSRTIVWLGPSKDSFRVAFILGDKAMQAARATKLPSRVVKALNAAPKYPEGTGVRLQVKAKTDLGAIKKLAAIKLAS